MNVQKPTSVARADFINDLATMINMSNLPAFILEPIMRDMWREVANAAQKQLELDRRAYEQQLTAMAEECGD